jgi:hypothetical protein
MKKTLDKFDWGWMDEPTDVYRILGDGSHKHMGQFHKDAIIQEIYVYNCYSYSFFLILFFGQEIH